MKILVTGGAGYIGSHVNKELNKTNKNNYFASFSYNT